MGTSGDSGNGLGRLKGGFWPLAFCVGYLQWQTRTLLGSDGPERLSLQLSVAVVVTVSAVYRPDLCFGFFQRIQVDHPVENQGAESTAIGVAFFLGCD